MKYLITIVFYLVPFLLLAQSKHEIPFIRKGAHMFVTVNFDEGKEYPFLFDTGASSNIVSTKLAAELALQYGKKSRVKSFGGYQASYKTVVEKMLINGHSFINEDFIILDNIGSGVNEYMGVIGCNFMSDKIVKIDNSRNIIIIADQHEGISVEGERMPLVNVGNVPGVDINIALKSGDSINGKMILDTGADAALISFPYVENKYGIAEQFERKIERNTQSPGGSFTTITGRLDEVSLGKVLMKGVPIKVMRMDGEIPAGNQYYLGFIGNKVLEKFDMLLNFPENYVILKPNDKFLNPIVVDPSGFTFMTNYKSEFIIVDVTEDGAADKAGLKPGDLIEKINRTSSSKYSLSVFQEMTSQIGRTFKFKVKRRGKYIKVKYTPVDAI